VATEVTEPDTDVTGTSETLPQALRLTGGDEATATTPGVNVEETPGPLSTALLLTGGDAVTTDDDDDGRAPCLLVE
jgi:hypothetical protein